MAYAANAYIISKLLLPQFLKPKQQIMKRKTDKRLVIDWACDERTIRNWRKAGAPLEDPKRMRAWLASRKHIPPGTATLLNEVKKRATVESAAQPQKLAEGPVAALKRLGEMEARAYTDLQRALSNGDPIEVKLARENWLKISESQRRADLAIEQSRRDAGELIPREKMLKLCHDFHNALYEMRFVFQDIVPSLQGLANPDEIWRVLQSVNSELRKSILNYFVRPRNAEAEIPKWMLKAVAFGSHPALPKGKTEDEIIENQAKIWGVLAEMVIRRAKEVRAEIDAKAKQKADEKKEAA